MIPVTKCFIPPIEEYMSYIKRTFDNVWLTNRGELVHELEQRLKEYLSVDNIIIMSNGTIPLQIALKLLGKGGEIITTPFSYVATTSAILWENCTPVFVDIDQNYLTIDENKIEGAITDKTTCILATHVYGNPCNLEVIDRIAKKYNLSVIYDAAHCFGVKYNGESIFNYGNISTCSFHATKLFHSGEGGALFCNDSNLFHKSFYSHNFGHDGPLDFHGLGINGKISELHASMGLTVLNHIDEIIGNRRQVVEFYDNHLKFNYYRKVTIREKTEWNYSYYPLVFDSEILLLRAQDLLNQNNIIPRRYFYPSLNRLPFLSQQFECPVSEEISKKVLCLPLYKGISTQDLKLITDILNSI